MSDRQYLVDRPCSSITAGDQTYITWPDGEQDAWRNVYWYETHQWADENHTGHYRGPLTMNVTFEHPFWQRRLR